MQNVKPWQVALFVAALAAVAYTGYRVLRGDGINVTHDLLVIDVRGGELFDIDANGKGIVLPAKHPGTGERTLFPVVENEQGEWVLERRALASIIQQGILTGPFIDRETGVVSLDVKKAKRVNARDLVKR